ncbi:arylamine N-acetyltransferase [Staphylococcus chromogenes]|uniref:Arylamine N-acetyltransferase n=1 Tax=Staphylococcus chromogenes TaxID=46126 RepID=A0AAE5T1B7_STACR|nr:arylamine N-acetyltransferase [Staphylococcus chromogenes]MBV5191688.1 arylamine N-acetyltransferase [Staphylococcus chromogenes]MBW3132167.1 arylamine N-acetyltransferase [Staphylococcus chromogenes]PTF37986.1 arylamine N-acetyltransferase [Staphylococcus chromogenes]PTF48555.1 arylamine N-acetyltransferase [Staphylococcus chromogenes]PTF52725.1 arylamine N-acetyltransferase [Staphylococcus chromogenes]
MDIQGLERYLNIDTTRFQAPTKETLNHDVERFMRTVPFENIDVQNGIPISVEVNDLYHKVVERQRGGFCYELNTLFKTYLIEKGFEVFNVSATIHTPGGGRSQPGSHMSTIVVIDGTHYIADVGFGDLPLQAIPLTEDAEHNVVQDVTGIFRAVFIDEAHKQFEVQKWENDAWDTKYEADITPRTIDMFEDNIKYNQTNPNSVFVKRLVITMPTEKGRATMSQNHLTLTEKGEKRKIDVTSDNYRQLLKTYFNLDVEIQRLET